MRLGFPLPEPPPLRIIGPVPMDKRETAIILTFLAVAIPVSMFVIGWWTAAAMFLHHTFDFPEERIWTFAFGGLAIGILIVGIRWRRWPGEFYRYPLWITIPVYIFWSLLATAILMGLPLVPLVVGTTAGIYIGRRAAHAGVDSPTMRHHARHAAMFTAVVTGLIALAMGLLALKDQHTLTVLLRFFGFGWLGATLWGRALVVAIAIPILAVIQYLLTRGAALWAHRALH